MPHCASCDAKLVAADRFCPACGTPNAAARLHPKFGPALRDEPVIIDETTSEGPSCPRCAVRIGDTDPFCAHCGMSLVEHRRFERQAGFHVRMTVGPDGRRPFHPLRKLTLWLQALLVVDALLAMVITVAAIASVPHFDDAIDSVRLDGGATKWTLPLQIALAVSLVVTMAVFLGWFVTAYRNLEPLGVSGLRRSTRLAIWCWFIPLVDLVLPKEMMDDLWRASDPDSLVFSDEWRKRSVPLRLHLWWTSALIAVVALVATQWVLPAPGRIDASMGRLAVVLVLFAYPILAVASLLLVFVVGDVAERQSQRVSALAPREESDRGVDTQTLDLTVIPEQALVHSPSVSISGRY